MIQEHHGTIVQKRKVGRSQYKVLIKANLKPVKSKARFSTAKTDLWTKILVFCQVCPLSGVSFVRCWFWRGFAGNGDQSHFLVCGEKFPRAVAVSSSYSLPTMCMVLGISSQYGMAL
jgi:hypothetical protein